MRLAFAALYCSLHANCVGGPEQVSEAIGEISRLISTNQRRGLELDLLEPKVRRVVSLMDNIDDIYRLGLTARIMFEGHDSRDKEACRVWEHVFWECAERQVILNAPRAKFLQFIRRADFQGLPRLRLEKMAAKLKEPDDKPRSRAR